MNLIQYIQGRRKGKEAHRIEREAMNDPFLAEALEGFDTVEGNHAETIRRMQRRVAVPVNLSGRRIAFLISAAASIAIIVGVGLYFLISTDTQILLPESRQLTDSAGSPPGTKALALVDRQEEQVKERMSVAVEVSEDRELLEIIEDEIRIDSFDVEVAKMETPIYEAEEIRGKKQIAEKHVGTDRISLQSEKTGRILQEDAVSPEEDVIVAYGVQKEKEVTGTLSRAVSEETTQKDRENTDPKPVTGKRAYSKYLKQELVRPVDDECARVKGTVVIRFKIDQNGRPFQLKVIQSLCKTADIEAMRLISEGSDWTLGDKEVTVRVKF